MAINEILSTYRQALQTERQFELSQMQLALGMLESQSNREFRESSRASDVAFRDEGRRREDMWRGLTATRTATQEQMEKGYGSIYTSFLRMPFIKDDGSVKESKARKYGFTDAQINDIETMMVLYANQQPEQGKQLAAKIAREVHGEYDYYQSILKDAGGDLPDYLKAFENVGIIDLSDDNREKVSISPFRDIAKGYDVLNNIAAEFTEMMEGDYELDPTRDVSISPLKEGYDTEEAKRILDSIGDIEGDQDLEDLINQISDDEKKKLAAGVTIDLKGTAQQSDKEIMQELKFLPEEDQRKISASLSSIASDLNVKYSDLDKKYKDRQIRINEYDRILEEISEQKEIQDYYKERGNQERISDTSEQINDLEQQIRMIGKGGTLLGREYYVSEGGEQKGIEGSGSLVGPRGYDANPITMESNPGAFRGTITADIISLSQEIEELEKQRARIAR